MRKILLILALCWPLTATEYRVGTDATFCGAGCYSTSITQALLNAVQPGDEIIFPPIATEVITLPASTLVFPNKSGADWITLRSLYSHLLPVGYRPSVGDSRLATLSTTYTGTQFSFGTDPAFTRIAWTSSRVGNVVTIGSDCSGGNPCELRDTSGNIQTFTAPPCTVTLQDVAVATAGTSSGQGTGLRVGIGTDGKCHISHKTDIDYPTQFTCTNCEPDGYNRSSNFNFPENAVPVAAIGYSTAGAATGFTDKHNWLSGPTASDASMPGLFNGTYANSYKGRAAGSHHWRFQGLDLYYAGISEATFGTMFFKDVSYEYQYVPSYIEWDRCLFRQQKASKGYWKWLYLAHGENISVKDTRGINTQNSSESGPFTILGSQGPYVYENVELDGNQNIFSGGGNMLVAGVPEIRIKRSLFRQRLEHRPLLRLVRQASTDTIALTTTDSATRCNAGTCTAYHDNTAYTYALDTTLAIAAGQAASIFVGVKSDGTFEVGHNSGANLTCSGSVTCTNGVTARSQMAGYAMLYEWTATAGVWAASASWSYSNYFHKNTLETKIGRDIQIVGNIFQNYWASGGQSCQVALTARNQDGQDITARLDGINYSRNKNIGAHCALSALSLDDLGWNTFGRNWHFNHNIFADISSSRWGASTLGGTWLSMGGANLLGAAFQHNTLDTSHRGFWQNANSVGLNSGHFLDNLYLWNPNSVSGMGGDSIVTWNSLHKADTTPVANWGYIHPDSTYRGNLNLGTGTIPASGWGTSWADLAGENFYNNQRVSSVVFGDYLASVSSPMAIGDNYRIKTISTKSVQNPAYDGPTTTTGMDPGADVDWVETLTDGVVEGYAPLASRWAVKIKREGTTATVRVSNVSTMTLTVSASQSMLAPVVPSDSTPDEDNGGHKRFDVTGLTAGVIYWYTLTDGAKVVKDRL